VNRKQLLATSLGAAVGAGSAAARAQTPVPGAPANPISRDTATLVLPGGGARGAYEAGAIEGLRLRAGISDGMPLPGINAVAGTSIGAINGWFVATAQYSLLAQVWQTISAENIFRIKKQYAATVTPSSGVLTRVFQAALISQGLTSNVTGLLDGARVRDWLTRHIDPTRPLVMTYVFTLTNLNEQRGEVFYRDPFKLTSDAREAAAQRLRSIFGKSVPARAIEDAHLVAALAGSSAIPILLDPVTIDFPDGPQTYIDGGVADSAPLDLARAFSSRVQLILVDPARVEPKRFPNAAAVGTVAFSIAQNRVLESSLRSAYLETQGKKLFQMHATTAEQRAFLQDSFDVDLFLIRPERELPVQVAGFDDADGIAKTYEFGRQAGLAGFRAYDPARGFGFANAPDTEVPSGIGRPSWPRS
jgi:predicted acylesterase/phospholipase RssA